MSIIFDFISSVREKFSKLTFQAIYTFILFICIGSGCNWVLPTVLVQEVPKIQQSNPAGYCTAAYMNASVNGGVISVIIYVIYTRYYGPLSNIKIISILLSLSTLGCFISALVYNIYINHISLFLYMCSFIGGIVGCTASVTLGPFLMNYENDYISATRLGGSFTVLLTSIVASIQSPGSSHPLFSVPVYFTIFGALLTLSLPSFYLVVTKGHGLRNPNMNRKDDVTAIINDSNSSLNPMLDDSSNKTSDAKVITINNIDDINNDRGNSSKNITDFHHSWTCCLPNHLWIRLSHVLINNLSWYFNKETSIIWLPQVLPYILSVGYIDMNTWGVLSSIIPLAMRNSSLNDGSYLLALSYEIGGMALVLGDFSTIFISIPIPVCLCVFTLSCSILYIAAASSTGFEGIGPFLVFLFALCRFLEAHVITSSFRKVATVVSRNYVEVAARTLGLYDQIVQTLTTVIVISIISVYVTC